MFLRSLLTTTSPLCFAPDEGGAPAAAPAAGAAPAEPGISTGREPAKEEPGAAPPLEDQLSKIWDDSHTPRDDRGRFASRNPAPADGDEPGDEGGDDTEFTDDSDAPVDDADKPAEGEDNDRPAGEESDDGAKEPTVDMPRSWSKDDAEVWNSIPPAAQQRIAAREMEMTQAISRMGRVVHAHKQAEPVLRAVEPFQQYLGQVGAHLGKHPAQLINDTLRFEHTLRTAPNNDVKLQVIKDIVAEYGVDVSPLIGAEAAAKIHERAFDPRVDALARQVHELTEGQRAERQAQLEADQATMERHIDSMAADAKQYPYFNQVRGLMAALLQANEDDGTRSYPDLLKDAYERACYADPAIRERILRDQRKREDEERQNKARQKTDAARKAAAVNVRSGTPSQPKRTMDDDISAVADRLYGR